MSNLLVNGERWKELISELAAKDARIRLLEGALTDILNIKNHTDGGDWDEIEEARVFAERALKDVPPG